MSCLRQKLASHFWTSALLLVAATAGANSTSEFQDFSDLDLAALLDAPVESASGRVQNISDAPAVIEVITRRQIEAWGASTLYDVLEHVVGVELIESHWGRTTVNIRGIQPGLFNDKVLVLIDQHPLYDSANMSFTLEQIPIGLVDRVEIIRGPGGVLFGTNAYAGVIHILTKNPDKTQASAAFAGGAMLPEVSHGGEDRLNIDGRAAGGWAWDNGGVRLDFQALKTPIWLATVDQAVRSDTTPGVYDPYDFPRGETDISLAAKLAHRQGNNQFRLLLLWHQQKKLKWGLNPRSEFESLASEHRTLGVVGYWDHQFGKLRLETRLGYDWDVQNNLAGEFPAIAFIHPGDPLVVEANTSKLEGGFTLSGDVWDGKIQGSSGFQASAYLLNKYQMIFQHARELAPGVPVLNTDAFSYEANYFGQLVYRPVTPLSLLAGIRINIFDPGQIRSDLPDPKAKISPNPRAGVLYRVHDSTMLKLLYGHAFRVPSMWNMFVEAAGLLYGDPSLRPETIDTVELALDSMPTEGLSLRLNGFVNISDNDIQLQLLPTGGDRYVNSPGKIIRGVELTSRYLFNKYLDSQLGIGFQEGFERQTNRYIDEIARVLITASSTAMLVDGKLRMTPSLRYIGPRQDLGGATLWNATAYYDPTAWLTVGLIAKNIFDKRYADVEPVQLDTPSGVVQNQPRTLSAYIEGRF